MLFEVQRCYPSSPSICALPFLTPDATVFVKSKWDDSKSASGFLKEREEKPLHTEIFGTHCQLGVTKSDTVAVVKIG